MSLVTVQVAKRVYQMTRKQARGLLKLAEEQVPLGIYAVEKNNVIELRCDHLTKTQTKERRRQYMNMGFRVYVNGV